MSKKPTVPPKEKPKKPLNFYFRLRAERLAVLEGQDNRTTIFAEEWKNLPEATKDAEKAKDKIENDKYRAEMDLWRKANPNEAKPSKKEKKGSDGDDSDDGARKVEKSRGKPINAAKDEDTEKGESKAKEARRTSDLPHYHLLTFFQSMRLSSSPGYNI